jgi:hypothetical protein
VALVRVGAVTHSVNMEQRYIPLSFTAGTGTLNATAPANPNVAPPGVYMLFLIDANGVPSVARMVRVGQSPTITFVRPAEDAAEVLPNEPIVVAFDTSMDKPSAEAAFSLKRTSDGAPVSGSFGWYGNALIFLPNADLAAGTQYTASVSTAAQNLGGFPLPVAKTWRFTTTNRPIIDRVYPAAGATGVSSSSVTYAIFNKAMDKPSAEAAFSLKRTSDGAPVSGSFGWYGNALIFLPNAGLAPGTQYTAAVSGAARDLAGNTLANPTTWRYTTGPSG